MCICFPKNEWEKSMLMYIFISSEDLDYILNPLLAFVAICIYIKKKRVKVMSIQGSNVL